MTAIVTGVHVFPCSFQQQRFWVLDQINPGAAVYTMPAAYKLRGALDPAALEAALDRVVDRHESLRTVFRLEGEAPVQVVRAHERMVLPVTDLRARPTAEREEAAAAAYQEMVNRPFDLAKGPLLRASLFRLEESEWILAIVVHHIAADGVSMGLLFAELERCYIALARGETPDLPALPLQYPDFAVWQRKQAESSRMQRQLAWWRERLAGPLPILDLPADRPRPALQSFRGARRSVAIPVPLAEAIRELGRREGATPFMTFLAVFQVLLHRHAAQDDVIVGVITSGRQRHELEPLIGLFLNTLAIRTDLAGEPTFRELLGRVRDASLGALENQDVPFDRVAEAVAPAADRSRSPIFQAGFQLLDGMGTDFALPGLAVEPFRSAKDSAPFDLTLFLFGGDTSGGLRATLDFNTDLFDADTADRLLARYVTLLESIATDPGCPVSRLPLLPDAERRRLLVEWNDTAAEYPRAATFSELFRRVVAEHPDRVAVEAGTARISFAELDCRADRLAAWLESQRIGPGALVGVCLQRGPQLVPALLAILRTGAAYVPIDPAYPAERIAWMLEDSRAALVLTEPALATMLPHSGATAVVLDESAWPRGAGTGAPAARQTERATPDGLAYVIYTSGSTGRPKGAMIHHRGLVNYLWWAVRAYDAAAGEGAPVHSSIAFDLTITGLFVPLLAGRPAILLPENAGIEALAALLRERRNLSLVKITPAHLDLLRLQLTAADVAGRTRRFVIGGENLLGESLAFWQDHAPNTVYVNEYGPTETVVGCCVETVTASDRYAGAVPIGRPIANTRLYILDRHGEPVPIGVVGELHIGGDGVGLGYLNQPVRTAESFLPDPFADDSAARLYRTGDRARWRTDGRIEFLGRLDDQVKLRGFRIELGEIEAVLGAAPGVEGAVVLVREDVPGDRRLVAYVAADGSTPPTPASLRELARIRLPEYMVPSQVVVLPSLPLTPNGKVDRQALPAPEPTQEEEPASEPPRTPLEREVAATMEGVLRRGPIGRNDDFFRLGGHSLLAMRLLGRLRAELSPELGLQSIFEHPTAAGLAVVIETTGGARAGTERIPRRPDRTRAPLSFGQEMLWVQAAMEPGLPSYNVPLILQLHGPLNADALDQAVTALVARHEPLRTAFTLEEGEPVQVIRAPSQVPLARLDLGTAGSPHGEALARAREVAGRPFDLAGGLLLRAELYRLAPDEHHLVLVTHHIATDGSSMSVLADDLAALYESAVTGRPAALPPVELQYGDFAAWQREHLRGERMERLLDFWKTELSGAPSVLALPTDRPATAAGAAGARCSTTLPGALLERLRQVGEGVGATLYMTLLSAWAVLLHRYSGQDDILVGTPVAGRDRPETERLFGFFINTLMIRVKLDPEAPFPQLLQQVRRACVDAFAHDEMPLGHLAQALRAAGGDAPWFQVTFTLNGAPGSPREFPGLRTDLAGVHLGSANFALGLIAQETPAGLAVTLEYRTDLFERATVERMLGHLATLLEAAATAADQPVSRLPMLTADEYRQLVEDWNPVSAMLVDRRTLAELFEAQAAAGPRRIALECEGRHLTYAELNEAANRVAHQLRSAGVGAGTLVALCADRSLELVIGLIGILKAGGAYLPIDLAVPVHRVDFILSDSAAPVVLAQRHLMDRLPPGNRVALAIEDLITGGNAANPKPVATEDSLAYVIYTSGSTGNPKGVLVTHANVSRLFTATEQWFGFGPGDVWTLFHSYAFDFSVWELWGALLYGGRLVVVPFLASRSPEAFLDLLVQSGVTVLNQTPSAFHQLMAADEALGTPGLALRWVIFGGEALDPAALAPWYARRGDTEPRLVNMYGITETTVHVTYRPISKHDLTGGSVIGVPIVDLQVYVLDALRQPVPIGVPGELYVGGAGVARGYLNRQELTDERFVAHPFRPGERLYRTGDQVRWLPGRDLEYLGRLDFQVKVRGFRIELGEIETALTAHPDIASAAVIVREDSPADRRLVAYFIPRTGVQPDLSTLRTHLKGTLPDYMVPAAFVELPRFPLTSNGKLDRKALPRPAEADAVEDYVAPHTPLEEAVAGIFAEVLGRQRVGVTASFFDLGGHSLLATQVVGRASRLFQVKVPLRAFFEAPTVATFAEALVRHEPKPGQVERIVQLLRSIDVMPEAERRALRRTRAADATPANPK